jgi:MFS family permease
VVNNQEYKFKKTRELSIKEAATSAVMSGAADSYVAPFAIELKASNFQIGLLTSLNGLISPLVQIVGSRLMERFNRRKIAFVSILLQAISLLGFVAIGLAFLWKPQLSSWPILFIIAYIVYGLSGALGGPAWFSMLGDAVPEQIRGRGFYPRNRNAK